MNVEIGTETPIFLFCEYLFRNFGILSLQYSVVDPDPASHSFGNVNPHPDPHLH